MDSTHSAIWASGAWYTWVNQHLVHSQSDCCTDWSAKPVVLPGWQHDCLVYTLRTTGWSNNCWNQIYFMHRAIISVTTSPSGYYSQLVSATVQMSTDQIVQSVDVFQHTWQCLHFRNGFGVYQWCRNMKNWKCKNFLQWYGRLLYQPHEIGIQGMQSTIG